MDEQTRKEFEKIEYKKRLNNWALMMHLSSMLMFFIPVIHIIVPILIWQDKKYEFPELDDHGKEVLNFNISIMIYTLIASILIIVVIGIILLMVIGVAAFVLILIGTIKAGDGVLYRYPLTIRFIK